MMEFLLANLNNVAAVVALAVVALVLFARVKDQY